MNNRKCYKCNGKIALVQAKGIEGINERWRCLPCLYNISITVGKNIMPFRLFELDKIHKGEKWTSLRSAIPKYENYPFEKIKVYINENGIYNSDNPYSKDEYYITDKVVKSEGFDTFEELFIALKKMRHKLPKDMYLYYLDKPI